MTRPLPRRRTGFLARSADFDGSGTDELLRTVALLLGACRSESELARLAGELRDHVERRDATVVLDQLAWRLETVRTLHARGKAER